MFYYFPHLIINRHFHLNTPAPSSSSSLPWVSEIFFIFDYRFPHSIYLRKIKCVSLHLPVQNPPRSANGCFAKAWISSLEILRLFRKGDVLPNWAAGWQSLSGFVCRQSGCGKIEMWIKAETCPDCEERASPCLYLVFFSIVGSCLMRRNSSSPERRDIFRLTLTWPHVNTLMLILYPLFTRSLSPHMHADLLWMFIHLHDISHAGFTPLVKHTSCSPCCNVFFPPQAYQCGTFYFKYVQTGWISLICFNSSEETEEREIFFFIYSLFFSVDDTFDLNGFSYDWLSYSRKIIHIQTWFIVCGSQHLLIVSNFVVCSYHHCWTKLNTVLILVYFEEYSSVITCIPTYITLSYPFSHPPKFVIFSSYCGLYWFIMATLPSKSHFFPVGDKWLSFYTVMKACDIFKFRLLYVSCSFSASHCSLK